MKSELVSIVSHELRTPLASVLGFTSLLLTRDFDEETRQRYLGIVDAQARRLGSLIDDFLDARRLEQGKLELDRERIELGPLLREQADLFYGQSERHRLNVALPPEPLAVRGDRDRLAQVIGNLLSNAIKYSPEGGVVELVGEDVTTAWSASRCATRASASPTTSSPRSSRGSSAAMRPPAASAVRASASPSRARSSRPTAAGSASRARNEKARRSGSSCPPPPTHGKETG